MAVFRVERNTGYTVMSNHHLRNKELSLKAKGLLSQMLSLPEDWDYTLSGLSYINREKIDAIREAVRELERAGYIKRSRERDSKGRLRGADYVIYEQPQPADEEAAPADGQPPVSDLPTLEKPILENPTLDNPMLEKPTLENPMQLNKDIQKTNLPKKEKSITDLSNTHSIPIHSGRLEQTPFPLPYDEDEAAQPPERKRTERNDAYRVYEEIIKDNIDYDILLQDRSLDRDRLNEIVDLMLETVCTARKKIRIAGDDYPAELVKSKFMKPNGKMRPLGIPTIVDRIVQQCVLQVMEPICEAKFSENSNGFRPNRSAETAIAQCMRLVQVQHLYHVVDLDIKGFFDNINHTKLIRQIWALGIQDKKLLCIIKEMLRAPIIMPNGEKVYPKKGTPQGGILSPLLANIVLNELDWWIASQWEEMPTKTEFKTKKNAQGTEIKSHIYRALRKSRLKEVHAVRYADDFKIFCASHEEAVRAYKATELWLKDRLGLETSPDKSKVVNLKRQYSEFLGFKLKVRKKGKKYVVRSHMSDKAYKKAHKKLSKEVQKLAHSSENAQFVQLQKYNSVVAGFHEYYCIATEVSQDFGKLAFGINKQLRNRLKGDLSKTGTLKDGFIKQKYGESKQLRFLHKRPIVPVGYAKPKNAQHKRKAVNKYTADGRWWIHKNLQIDTSTMLWVMRNPVRGRTIEYADNRISLYAAQYGKCAVTGKVMFPHDIHCHHKVPVSKGGTDEYTNLVLICKEVHTVIHASQDPTIEKFLKVLNLEPKQLLKLNKLRKLAEMPPIIL